MGLDIYSGTLTRYYARNWRTSVQRWGEENGMQVNIVRANEQEGEAVPPEEILADVTAWRDQLVSALSKELSQPPLWNEDIGTTPYYTEKPDWDAVGALTLYTVCRALDKPVPETVDKSFDVWETPEYKAYAGQQTSMISLFSGGGWWLPIADSFAFKGYLPTGREVVFATVGMLKATPHDPWLTPLHIICLPAFRHITQILLDLRQQACVEFRQSDEKLDGASDAQGSCGVALKTSFCR